MQVIGLIENNENTEKLVVVSVQGAAVGEQCGPSAVSLRFVDSEERHSLHFVASQIAIEPRHGSTTRPG